MPSNDATLTFHCFMLPFGIYELSDTAGTNETVRPGNDNLVRSSTTSQESTVRPLPTTADSSNRRSYGTDPKAIIQEVEEIRSGMEAMSNRFLADLASARTSITEQLATQLEATRAAICKQVSVKSASLHAFVEGLHPKINSDNGS